MICTLLLTPLLLIKVKFTWNQTLFLCSLSNKEVFKSMSHFDWLLWILLCFLPRSNVILFFFKGKSIRNYKQSWAKKRWNIQHVTSVGQRKKTESVHRSDALTNELLGDSWRPLVIFTRDMLNIPSFLISSPSLKFTISLYLPVMHELSLIPARVIHRLSLLSYSSVQKFMVTHRTDRVCLWLTDIKQFRQYQTFPGQRRIYNKKQ